MFKEKSKVNLIIVNSSLIGISNLQFLILKYIMKLVMICWIILEKQKNWKIYRKYSKFLIIRRITLQEDAEDLIHLKNLSVIPVSSEEDALNLLFVGDTNRMIAETPSNPSSSRSHCIFIISVSSRSNNGDTIRKSKLHLVDLAG